MKKILIIFIFFVFGISGVNKKSSIVSIYIDPGHGGYDGGAVVGDVIEGELNLLYSSELKDILESNGYKVYMTRYDDRSLYTSEENRKRSDLNERISLINESNCSLFISIHMNMYSDSKYSGGQVFYSDRNDSNKEVASLIQNSLINTKRIEKEVSNIYLLNNIIKPGCLIECGFLSNDLERENLIKDSYRRKICMSIYMGISNYFNFSCI